MSLGQLAVLAIALSGLSARLSAQGSVWIVDDTPGPGVDFSSIQAAVNAAVDGDVLLVKSGDYVDLSINGKALTIQAEAGASVRIGTNQPIRVLQLAPTKRVLLRGLVIRGFHGMQLSGCAGPVWVEDCTVNQFRFYEPGIQVANSDSVALLRTGSRGGDGDTFFGACDGSLLASAGLEVDGSSAVHVFGCTLIGGRGGACHQGLCRDDPLPGAPGIAVAAPGGFLFLSDANSTGGSGLCFGEGFPFLDCVPPICSQGGAGLQEDGDVHVLDSSLIGAAAVSTTSPPFTGAPGEDIVGDPDFLRGKALRFEASSPVREGESVALSFEGPPWTPVYLATGSGPNAHFVENVRGTVLVSELAQIEFVGFTGADGTLETTRDLPDLPAGVDSTLVFYQALYVVNAPAAASMLHDLVRRLPRFVLGAGSMVVQLDEQF